MIAIRLALGISDTTLDPRTHQWVEVVLWISQIESKQHKSIIRDGQVIIRASFDITPKIS